MKILKLEYHFDQCEIREFHGISFPTGEDGGSEQLTSGHLTFVCYHSQLNTALCSVLATDTFPFLKFYYGTHSNGQNNLTTFSKNTFVLKFAPIHVKKCWAMLEKLFTYFFVRFGKSVVYRFEEFRSKK